MLTWVACLDDSSDSRNKDWRSLEVLKLWTNKTKNVFEYWKMIEIMPEIVIISTHMVFVTRQEMTFDRRYCMVDTIGCEIVPSLSNLFKFFLIFSFHKKWKVSSGKMGSFKQFIRRHAYAEAAKTVSKLHKSSSDSSSFRIQAYDRLCPTSYQHTVRRIKTYRTYFLCGMAHRIDSPWLP